MKIDINLQPALFLDGIKDPRVLEALVFGIEKHGDQKRKYTEEPYINHPIAVASLVQALCQKNKEAPEVTANMVCAALLHDTVEDCRVTFEEICDKFGPMVRDYVYWLTDPTKGLVYKKSSYSRKFRKAIQHQWLDLAPPEVLVIKACDVVHNASSIMMNDKGSGPLYLEEVMELYARVEGKIKYPEAREAWRLLGELRSSPKSSRGAGEASSKGDGNVSVAHDAEKHGPGDGGQPTPENLGTDVGERPVETKPVVVPYVG